MAFAYPPTEISPLLSAIILADDLTGACDSAAAFAVCGRDTRVALDFKSLEKAQGHVLSCSLESRNLSPQEAARRMSEAVKGVPQGAGLLYCKIDSAGRGPIGASTLSLADAVGCDWTIVTPAYPDQGRRVRNGVLQVETGNREAARQVPLASLFPEESEPLLAAIAVGNVEECRRQISAALAAGKRILLCDAETQGDLSTLVEAARRANHGRVLWCGSAGLARALAELDSPAGTVQGSAFEPGFEPGIDGPCLVFAGTPHRVTAVQLQMLAQIDGVLRINCECGNGTFAPNVRCVVVNVKCGETTDSEICDVWRQSHEAWEIRGLVLTGGDTASMVLRALKADSILIRGEVANGIPWGIIEGGLATGHRVVTKSGGFGNRSSLMDVVRFLEQSA